jgi:hypothetical protein
MAQWYASLPSTRRVAAASLSPLRCVPACSRDCGSAASPTHTLSRHHRDSGHNGSQADKLSGDRDWKQILKKDCIEQPACVREYIRHGVENEPCVLRLAARRALTAKTAVLGKRARAGWEFDHLPSVQTLSTQGASAALRSRADSGAGAREDPTGAFTSAYAESFFLAYFSAVRIPWAGFEAATPHFKVGS